MDIRSPNLEECERRLVRVYFNLNKKVFSIMDSKTRRVIAHSPQVFLKEVKFKVSEAGRQRVIKEKRKNVHAFVVGYLAEKPADLSLTKMVTYNPYKAAHFVEKETGKPMYEAEEALLENRQVMVR